MERRRGGNMILREHVPAKKQRAAGFSRPSPEKDGPAKISEGWKSACQTTATGYGFTPFYGKNLLDRT
jgi:hypothetical protein